MWAGELDIHAFRQGRVNRVSDSAQTLRIQVGQVDKCSALQRGSAGEIDMVADQNRLAGAPLWVQPSTPVGQDDGASSCGRCRPHPVGNRSHSFAFVVVRS